jgi:sialate O-acetylesterase
MKENFPADLDVWVLAGQSNMQGCGLLDGALATDDRVWCFSSAGCWEVACEPLHRLWESFTPVHQNLMRLNLPEEQSHLSNEELAVRDEEVRVRGAGLGLAFGKAMAEATGRQIGLIAAAHGGTSLEQWSHERKAEGGASFYGAMLERIRRAGGKLRGVLWYQGESDAELQHAATYAQRLTDWIADLRLETGQPELPVLMVQIGRYITPPTPEHASSWDRIREILATLPQRVPNTATTSAVDLGLADAIHIDTPGLIRLGSRLARLAQELQANPRELAGPQISAIEQIGSDSILLRGQNVHKGWQPQHHMSGFVVCDNQGLPHSTLKIIDASCYSQDSTAIRILLTGPLTTDTYIGYGLGYNPYCNVVDGADMPLCSFLPRAVSRPGEN